jgi:very-short-patch-repair endonuclease
MITKENFIKKSNQIHGFKYDYSKVNYNKVTDKVCIICPEHGEFWQEARQHYKGQGCPKCSIEKRSRNKRGDTESFIKKAKEIYGNKYEYSKVEYVNSQKNIIIICPEHGEFQKRPDTFLQGHGCPKCGRKTIGDKLSLTKEQFIEKSKEIHGDKYDYSKANYINQKTKVCIICPEHGEFWQNPYTHYNGNGCPKCGVIKRLKTTEDADSSSYKEEIYDFIKKITTATIIRNDNKTTEQTLDFVMPEKKLAIEFDGLFWHCEKIIKDKNYHLKKTENCAKAGYQLIHIFEDEWVYKKDICKSRIMNLLGVNEEKHYARKCVIRELTKEESSAFFKQNHIQGNVGGSVCLGLFDNNELVSAMSFSELRKNLGSEKQKNTYELLRFANKLNASVCGGASKLFKHFVKTYNPQKVISYADRRWSVGKLYETLGFQLSHISRPSYFYVFEDTRKNRFGYRKDVLIKKYGCKPEQTEHEFCLSKKWYRIYDCGTMVYTWRK